jgi:hypothetical protein
VFDGADGKPGDPYTDTAGDFEFQLGECLSWAGIFVSGCDCGLDGICPGNSNYEMIGPDEDGTEGDGIWQPGDGWIDGGDGVVNSNTDSYICPCGFIEGTFQCAPYSVACEYGDDVWPPKNGYWDVGERIYDYGRDGLPNTGDPGENDGLRAMDGFSGEPFTDCGFDDLGDLICEDDENWNDTFGNGKYDVLIQGEGNATYSEAYVDLNNNGGMMHQPVNLMEYLIQVMGFMDIKESRL